MLRLAIIGSPPTTQSYRDLTNRLDGATFTAEATPSSVDELLQNQGEGIDAIVIDSTAKSHPELILKAAQTGKPVLVNGLGAESTEALKELESQLASKTANVMWGLPWTLSPSITPIASSLDLGKLGAPGLIRIHQWDSVPLNEQSLIDRAGPAVHLACWLFDETPEVIFGLPIGSPDTPQGLQIHFGFAQGGMALIDLTWSMPEGNDYQSFSLIGSTGAAYADDHRNMNLLYNGSQPTAIKVDAKATTRILQVQQFVDAIQAKTSFPASSHATILKITEACVEASNHSRPCKLNDTRYELA